MFCDLACNLCDILIALHVCVTASSKVKQLPWIIPYTAAAVPQVAADQGGSASLGDHCIHNVAILTSQSECLHVRWCDDRQHVCSLWNL